MMAAEGEEKVHHAGDKGSFHSPRCQRGASSSRESQSVGTADPSIAVIVVSERWQRPVSSSTSSSKGDFHYGRKLRVINPAREIGCN